MKKWIPFLLFCVVIAAGSVNAQAALQFEEMVIELWPEYDRPDVLIIYRAYLSPEVSLPAELTFQIPSDAGQPNAVAVRAEDGSLVTVDYDRVVRGDWADVIFVTPSQEIQFEYYDPSLVVDGNQRSFVFDWKSNFTSNLTILRVQNPAGATDMRITPPFSSSFRGSDGLLYYTHTLENLQEKGNFPIRIEYQRESDALSIEDKPVQPSVPITPGLFSGLGTWNILPYVLGSLGVALMITAGILYWRFGKQGPGAERKRKPPSSEAGGKANYCTRCGNKIHENDRFCRSCGAKLGK